MHGKWWPSSKITAVGVSGVMYTWGVWILDTFYNTTLEPLVISANQTWILFLIGYAITENRQEPNHSQWTR